MKKGFLNRHAATAADIALIKGARAVSYSRQSARFTTVRFLVGDGEQVLALYQGGVLRSVSDRFTRGEYRAYAQVDEHVRHCRFF